MKRVCFGTTGAYRIWRLLRSFRIIRQLFEKNQSIAPRLHQYAQGLEDFSEIAEMIFQKIRNGQVDSNASRELRKIRGTIENMKLI